MAACLCILFALQRYPLYGKTKQNKTKHTHTQYPKLLLSIYLFPGSSAGKESSCNAGDPGSIPGSGRSPREGMGYPFQYSWASVVAQMVKNLPAMQETRV